VAQGRQALGPPLGTSKTSIREIEFEKGEARQKGSCVLAFYTCGEEAERPSEVNTADGGAHVNATWAAVPTFDGGN
jgi:hypothetical protein